MPKLNVNKIEIHYQCFGEGENVVLIHGLAANLAFWYPIASQLSDSYRAIAYDLRGHGKSSMPISGYAVADMVRDLDNLLEYIGSGRTHVVGHSFGARIALHYAIAHPQKVASLTVADTQFRCLQPQLKLRDWPYWETWKQQQQQQGFQVPDDDEVFSFQLLLKLDQMASEQSRGNGNGSPKRISLRNRYMGKKGAERWQKLLSTTTAQSELDEGEEMTQAQIKELSVPLLAIFGEQSHCLPSGWKLKELVNDCRMEVVPDVGHFHPAIKPEIFLRTVREFIEEHPIYSPC